MDSPETFPGDFLLGNLRKHIREKLIRISNQLFDRFGGISTPIEYDREVLKKIEAILRVYDTMRHDNSWAFLIGKT